MSNYDVGHCCCLQSCCGNQERVDRLISRSCNEKCCVKEKRGIDVDKIKGRMARHRRDFRRSAVGDAEAMLSLLSEEIIEECVVVREKKRSSSLEGKVVCKQDAVIAKLKDRKANVDRGFRESKSKNDKMELVGRVQYREEGRKRNEEREKMSKDEDGRLRKKGSSSSYYSHSDSGEFVSDVEVDIEQEQFVGESLTSHRKDSRNSTGIVIKEDNKEDWKRYRDEKDQVLESSKRDDWRVGGSIQQDWRKKSEKKLTEESEETNSRNNSVVRQSQLSQGQQSNSLVASSSKKQLNYQEEQSTSDVKSFGQSSSRASKDTKASGQYEYTMQNYRENVDSTSSTWRRSSKGEDSKIVGKSIQETGCDYCETCGRNMENSKTQSDIQRLAEQTETNIDANLITSAENLSEIRQRTHGKSLSSNQSAEEKRKQHNEIYMVTGETSEKRKSQHYREKISIDESHVQSTLRATQHSEARMSNLVENSRTTAESQSESRRKKEEKSSSSLQISAKKENKQHDEIHQETGQVSARRTSQNYSVIMDTDARYLESTFKSQQQSENRMKHLEEKSALLIAAEDVKRLHEESGAKVTTDIESSKVSHAEIGTSGVCSSNLEIISHSAFDKREYNEQAYSKSKVKSVEELVEKRKQIDETIVQSMLRTEIQGPSTGHYPGEAIISEPSIPIISQTGFQQHSGEEVRSGQLLMRSPPSQEQLLLTSPPYQYVSRRSQFDEASSSSVRIDTGKTMEVGSGSTHKHPQARTTSFYGEAYDSGNTSGEDYTPDGALVSAARMQESSTMIVGEFVEKMGLEASTSMEKKLAKADLKLQHKKNMMKGSTDSDSDETGLLKQDSKHPSRVSSPDFEKTKPQKLDSKRSSVDSGTKGSSDQMWDVKDHFVQEASEMESLEGASSESLAVVRTGKTLWNIVAGIYRLRWGLQSQNQKSPVKVQSSPSGSAGGDIWFSENEADEANGDGIKAEQLSLLEETSSSNQSSLETHRSEKVDVLDDKLIHVDVGASSSSVLQSISLSDAFVGKNSNLNVPQHVSLPSPPVDLSIPSARQLGRSNAFAETGGAEKNESPLSSSEEQSDFAADIRQADVIASEGTDDEHKRRKLQRSKVVLQRFDEWEDAYRREREQRKVDEIFMREALTEAIKAADSWEVPVGAVLVQNGKIIARGYNLVEELRDSTAHAEMLCIREASNVLRTWRLSETTLYVTLEPCPMCAGAILQARISTLVWGAPNKLLGADGSWIRLFPEGAEEQRSEVMDKPAAPVHPFHPKMNIRRGILQEECADIMQQFFQLKRRKAKEKDTSSSDESGQPSCFPKPHHRSKLLHKMHNVFHHSKQQAD